MKEEKFQIAVCIKQVPESSEVDMDPKKGLLLRGNANKRLNPFDTYALEAAVRLKEESGGELTAFTMGPETATDVLKSAFAFGADRGVLITDKAFSGADVLATAKTLADSIRACGTFDVVIFGRQTTDGDTGQVGAETAQKLGITYLGEADIVEYAACGLNFERELTGKLQKGKIGFPCAVSITQKKYKPRIPSLKMKLESAKKQSRIIVKESLKGSNVYGLEGSATSVKKIYPIYGKRNAKRIEKEELLQIISESVAE